MSWKTSINRRKFLGGMGVAGALPFLESLVGRQAAHGQTTKQLKRLIIVSQSHMALGYHRIPEFAKGAYGAADPSLLKVDAANGVRIGAFGTTPGKLGGFYEQGAFKTNARLQKEMMVVNGLAMNYADAQGHISDGNGSWSGGGQSGKFNTRTRYALSGSLHAPMVTIDSVIAKKIHTAGQRTMFMGDAHWGGGGADTDESIDANGAGQSLSGSTSTIYNGPIFDAGKKVTAAMVKMPGGTPAPVTPTDPLADMSNDKFAALMGLRFSQEERKRLLAEKSLSSADKKSLEQYYDLLNEGLSGAEKAATSSGGSGSAGSIVSTECKPLTTQGSDLASFNKLMGVAFLCDLSRIGYLSVGQYEDHNTVWHAGADGDSSKLPTFNKLANQVSQVAEFLTTLIDPTTGRDMLENSIVLGITNCSPALTTDGRDSSHSYHDFSYFSVGGSVALNTGNMFDFLGYNNGKRPVVSGPIPSVNQYLQTVAAGFGLTSADWSPAGSKGFGPWSSNVCAGRPVRSDDAAKTGPIPGLLKV